MAKLGKIQKQDAFESFIAKSSQCFFFFFFFLKMEIFRLFLSAKLLYLHFLNAKQTISILKKAWTRLLFALNDSLKEYTREEVRYKIL